MVDADRTHDEDVERAADALLTDEPEVQDDDQAIFDLMDNDPQVREAVKNEMKRRLFQAEESQPQPQSEPTDEYDAQLDDLRRQLDEHEQWIDLFFSQPSAERNYDEYERRQVQARRLDRQERLLLEERNKMRTAVQNADRTVNQWIQERVQNEKRRFGGRSDLERYADRVRSLAAQLPATVRADPSKLREALRLYAEPNAYKAWREQERFNRSQGQQARHGSAVNESHMDDGGEAPRRKGKYDDADPSEREFLRGVGLLREERQGTGGDQGMIPTDNGYIIPVGRGKRNTTGRDNG